MRCLLTVPKYFDSFKAHVFSRVSLNALSLYIINSESHPMAGVMHFTASILIKKQAFRLPSLAWSNRDILY